MAGNALGKGNVKYNTAALKVTAIKHQSHHL